MSGFESISEQRDFVALNAKRDASLVQLKKLSKALEKLSKDEPPLHYFEHIEAKIDNKVEKIEAAERAVSTYFTKAGGDALNVTDFDNYCDVATNITGQIEILRDIFQNNLKSKDLLQPVAVPPTKKKLLDAIKTLAESTE